MNAKSLLPAGADPGGSLDRKKPSVRITSRSGATLVAMAAAALIVAGQLASPAPSRAVPSVPLHPPCTNNWVAYGPNNLDLSDGLKVKLNWNGQSVDSSPDGALLLLQDGTPAQVDEDGHPVEHGGNKLFDSYHSDQTGTAAGGIRGNNVDITVVWDSTKPISSNRFIGTINPDGWATGTDTNSGNHITTNWTVEAAFPCGG
jgi:hypothetical protein